MLVPLLARKGVVVVRVRPVALGRKDLTVGIIPVVVGALALMFLEVGLLTFYFTPEMLSQALPL